ncbi:MAG: NAD-dependent epimerase/dehydratase family protein [Thermoflexibacter sp.]|jgi:nucleoside-diphosphate-sugar epimerase|nr:NAD-dependent epimerase/dehydratase family protein [Thermoflexibacter sp.]
MNEKYFITGTTGLVGSYIARKLIAEGREVYALKRKNSNTLLVKDIENKINWVEGNILDVSILFESIRGMDYVIHAAANVSMLTKDKSKVFKTNIEGTANVVNACLEAGVKKFCHISSVAAIGIPEKATTINEKAIWNEDDKDFIYAKSKHYAELEVWRGMAEGLDVLIVNPSTVLGISPLDRSSGQIIDYLSKGVSFYPKGNINLVDAEDVAEIVFELLHHSIANERFILNAGILSYKEFFSKISYQFGKSAPRYAVGKGTLNMIYFLSKIGSWLGLNSKPLSQEIINATQSTHTYSNEKICNLLNFKFKSIEESIEKVCHAVNHSPYPR